MSSLGSAAAGVYRSGRKYARRMTVNRSGREQGREGEPEPGAEPGPGPGAEPEPEPGRGRGRERRPVRGTSAATFAYRP